ncbi:hypothetical protein CLOP_g19068 [Closterium sp. NIES-67]|nr:hypothetical protein CLOP_g19068 [Closterium sp. NIES-67]
MPLKRRIHVPITKRSQPGELIAGTAVKSHSINHTPLESIPDITITDLTTPPTSTSSTSVSGCTSSAGA